MTSWEADHQAYGRYIQWEMERMREMGIEWPEDDHQAGYAGVLKTFIDRQTLAQARIAQRRLDEMERIDWGLLDEFLVYVGQDGLWLQHARCKRPDAPARWRQSVADLLLAVEEHMKECGK